jgi:ribonuclease HI
VTHKAAHGIADLAEFNARLAELRATLGAPTQPGAYEANTDGACLGNPDGPGGWAAVVEHLGESGRTWELWGHLSSTSNNRAEALGMLAAIQWVPTGSGLLIRSDSELTVRIMAGAYKARANVDLWTEIRRAIPERGLQVQTQWVRGHAGDIGNERADALSVLGAVQGDVDRWERQRAASPPPRRAARQAAEVPAELVGLEPRGGWEESFLSSVARQLRAGRALSQKQQAVIDRIRARRS